jgi:protocatechuate 3,4-dioxygenase beta subunit
MTRKLLWTLAVLLLAALLWWLLRGDSRGLAGPDEAARGPAGPVADLAAVADRARLSPLDLRRADRAAIAGHVRDTQGRPIAGATVCAGSQASQLTQVERAERHCVTSESDGSYRIEGLIPVPHFVNASAPTYVPRPYLRGKGPLAEGVVRLQAGQEARDIDIVLRPGGVLLTGVVRDISGGELEGALVSAGYAHARSGADGGFSLWVQPGSQWLNASAEGYADGYGQGIAPGHVFEIYLTPESVLVGRVVRAADGAPLADAEVWASDGSPWGFGKGPAITDAGGNFRIVGLEPGAYKAEAFHDEAYGTAEESAVLGLGETSEPVTVTAHPAYVVEGTVAVAGGESCERGEVELTSKPQKRRVGKIEADGSVRLRGVLAGTYEVKVECTGFVAMERYEPVVVEDAPVRGLKWEVRPGQAIRGKVVTARGEGVRDVWIYASPLPDPSAPRAMTTSGTGQRTEAEGDFEVVGLLPGRYKLEAWSEDQPQPDKPVEVELKAGKDLEGVRIELPAVGEVRGTVRDSKGEPVKNAQVNMRGEKWGAPSTRTIDDGTFRIASVPAGEYRVSAGRGWKEMRAPGTTDDDVQGTRVTIVPGEVHEVELVVEAQGGTISGRVIGADGGPLSDAFIGATRESDSAGAAAGGAMRDARWASMWSDREPTLTDQDGRFTMKGLPEGTYTLLARRRGGGEGTAEHVAIGGDVVIRIADAGSLAGTVRIAGGGPPQQFKVSLREPKTGFSAQDEFFRTGGAFRFPEVPAGKFEVVVESPEGSAQTEASVSEGGRGEVRVELAPRVTVRGKVVELESGEPVPGMTVRFDSGRGGSFVFFGSPEGASGGEVTDEQGRYEVEKVAAGEVSVLIHPKSFSDQTYGWSSFSTTITASGASAVELPPFKLAKSRVGENETGGDLGFKLREAEPDAKPEEGRRIVAFVQPGGPATQAGLQAGDEIVSVDGHDVTGVNGYLFYTLTQVKVGTQVRLGLARGASVEVTASKMK